MAGKSAARPPRKRRGALKADPAGESVRLEVRLPRDAVRLLNVSRSLVDQTPSQWIEAAIRERTAGLVVQLRGGPARPADPVGEAAPLKMTGS